MSVKQFAAQLKELIEDINSKGTAAIYCEDLIAYLNKVQNSPEIEPTAVEIERFKAYFQNWVESRVGIDKINQIKTNLENQINSLPNDWNSIPNA